MSTPRPHFDAVSRGRRARISKTLGHVANVMFALCLVLSATFALAETELLAANASHLSDADLLAIVWPAEAAF